MKIAVLVKEVPDLEVRVKLEDDGRLLDVEERTVLNFFDEIAVEAGLKLREGGAADEVYVVSAGAGRGMEAVRRSLAMGADAGRFVDDPALAGADPVTVAKALAAVIEREGYDVVLAGKQSTDDETGLIGPMVAEMLGIPCVTGIVELEVEDGAVQAARELPDGRERVRIPLPCLLTTEKGLYEPRVPQVMGVMKAMKVEVPTVSIADLGVEPAETFVPDKFYLPEERPPVTMIEGEPSEAVAELIRRLREEAKVL